MKIGVSDKGLRRQMKNNFRFEIPDDPPYPVELLNVLYFRTDSGNCKQIVMTGMRPLRKRDSAQLRPGGFQPGGKPGAFEAGVSGN